MTRNSASSHGEELHIDLEAADWQPGESCPVCGNETVHAIIRAGMQFHADGSWDFDETLAMYEVFCPACDWLPPVASTESRKRQSNL